jgi:hypothetical protein
MADDEELPESALADPWAAHLPGQELVPAYFVSRLAAQYRAIVEVMLEAQDTSLTGVAFDEVLARIRAYVADLVSPEVADELIAGPDFSLDARLDRLVRWRVLTRWQDPARSGEDFLRRRDRYQLTPAAARLHAFWVDELEADEDTAADLTLAPRAIHDRLDMFARAVTERRYPAAAAEFQQIIVLHQGMAAAARTWQRSLAHALSGGPDPAKQETLWRTLQSHVGMWGEQVDVYTPRIARLIDDLGPAMTGPVWRACVRALSIWCAACPPAAARQSYGPTSTRPASSWSSRCGPPPPRRRCGASTPPRTRSTWAYRPPIPLTRGAEKCDAYVKCTHGTRSPCTKSPFSTGSSPTWPWRPISPGSGYDAV